MTRPPSGIAAFIFLLVGLATSTLALQANLAGVIDWHVPLVGKPLLKPTPPTLVETALGKRGVLITEKNVLAVLDQQGSVVWRQRLEDDDPVVSYHVVNDGIVLLSGPAGSTVRLFALETGRPRWETHLSSASSDHLTHPVYLGTDIAITPDHLSAVVLSGGRRVSRLSLRDGKVDWSLEAPGAGDTMLFKGLHISGDSVHLLALTSSFASTQLGTMTLALGAGVPTGDMGQIPSIVTTPQDCVLSAGAAGRAQVVWHEHGRIRSAPLWPDGTVGQPKDVMPGKGKKFSGLLDVGKAALEKGLVLGVASDGSAVIVDVIKSKVVDSFEGSQDGPDHSPSTYLAVKTAKGVAFHRLYWSFSLNMAMSQLYHVLDDGMVVQSGFTFAFDTQSHGVMLAVGPSQPFDAQSTDQQGGAAPTLTQTQLPTLLVTTSTGALQYILPHTGHTWTREEGLTDLKFVKFIDLGEPEVEETRHVLTDETYVGRLARHLAELRDLPAFIIKFIARFTSSSYASTLSVKPLNATELHRDQFGFQKLVLGVTSFGKLYALDSSSGQVVWSKSLGRTTDSVPELEVVDMKRVRDVAEGGPMVDVLAIRTKGQTVRTVAFQVDALTGDAGEVDSAGLPQGKELFDGKPKTAFLLPQRNCHSRAHVLGVVDQADHLYIYPFCKKVARELSSSSSFSFHVVEQSLSGTTMRGLVPATLALSDEVRQPLGTTQAWTMVLPADEKVLDVTPVINGPLASFGRVTGDKQTLYKYLNPHLLVVTTLSSTGGTVYAVDSVTGSVVYSAAVDAPSEGGLEAIMEENWLVLRWKSEAGWRIASVEMYENRTSSAANTPGLSSYADPHHLMTFSKTFILPGPISDLGLTTSKLGVNAKELIFVNAQGQLATLPRRLLDPRRPEGKPTSGDKEEMLIPYEALIPTDPKRIVSHHYPVLGLRHIATSPSLLESTSLLFAHGLDLFGTRLTPGGTFDLLSDSFNKPQLLLTLAVLSIGILVAKPAVERKRARAKWY